MLYLYNTSQDFRLYILVQWKGNLNLKHAENVVSKIDTET